VLLLRDLRLRLLVHRRLLELHADVEADQHEHGGEQERDPPAPGLEVGIGLHGRQDEQHAGGEQVAQWNAGLRPGRPVPAAAVVAVLGRHQDRAAPLAADGEALGEPADEQQDRCRDADRRVCRQQADREGRDPHHHQRDDQHLLAADAIAEVPEDDAAERTCREPDRIGTEREKGRVDRIGVREEQRAEDECGG
jgi:hypothetical protein